MFLTKKKHKKNLAVVANRVGSFSAVVGFAFFLALSPLLVNIGPNPTGIYRQVAEAAPNRCFTLSGNNPNPTVCPSNLAKDESKCYQRASARADYREIDCPDQAPTNPNANKCYNHQGLGVNCPDEHKDNDGKCFQREGAGRAGILAGFKELDSCSDVKQASADGDDEPVPEDDTAAGDDAPSCEERMALSAGWIVCGILETLSSGMQKMLDYVDDMLNVDALQLNDSDELRTVWSYFRAIATFALFAVGLVMVISQAIGGGS